MNQMIPVREDAEECAAHHRPEGSRSVSGARLQRRDAGQPSLPLSYYRTIARYRWLIGGMALLGLAASFLLNLTTLPVYQARTSIDVQTLNGDFMNIRSAAPTSDPGASSDSFVQTQIKLLQSETLLEHTAARLEAEPHPAFVERNDLLSRVERTLHLSRSEPLPYGELVNNAALNMKVKPIGLTRLIEITCDSWNADFSVKFCNTLTKEFQEEDLQSRGAEAQKTSDWLTHQAEDIRIKAEDLQKRLETAVGGNGLILSQNSNSVGEDRLRDLQQELIRAKADRMEKEAQSAIAASSSADTVPGVVDRPAYQSYQQKLADLRTQVAQLVPPLTEENPRVIHLRSQIREVEAGLDTERTADKARMQNEYDASRHREFLLNATYQAALANVSADLDKASQVSLLRREVESEQQLYQTLLQRAKEAGFASAMQASTVHIVDAARKPKMPIAPRRGSSGVVGLMLGTAVGLGWSFFKDRNFEMLRLPGDITRHLHVSELGVIPSSHDGVGSMAYVSRTLTLRGAAKLEDQDPLALARWDDDFSIMAEAYRNATLSIMLSDVAKRSRTYLIASPNAGDGKTSVTSNLGVALSRSKLRVLLVDGDLRRPRLHIALGVPNDFGLRDLLRSEGKLDDISAAVCKPTEIANLWVLPSGTGGAEAVELLHPDRIAAVVGHLRNSFDVILIDSPPMLHMVDARLIAGQADGVILIVRSGFTMLNDAAGALDLFDRDGVRIIGTILNDFNPSKEGHGNYYRSYYRYKEHDKARSAEAVS